MRHGNCVECGNSGDLYGGEVCSPCAQQRRTYGEQQANAVWLEMRRVHERIRGLTSAAANGADCGEAQRRQMLRDLAVLFQDDDVVRVLGGPHLGCILDTLDARKLGEASDRLREWRKQLDATHAYRMTAVDVAGLAAAMDGMGQGAMRYAPPRTREVRHVEHWQEAD